MRLAILTFCLLGTGSFSLTTYLEPWFQGWAGNRVQSGNVLSVTLGDSRRLFAKHFYVKADAYFHSGYYPTIYDTHSEPDGEHSHMAGATGAAEGAHEKETDFLGKPHDWIDAFGRHFFPSTHRHLGETEPGQPPGKAAGGEEREILPWLRLSANLDPEHPETYIIASFWLRSVLGKVDQAEQFLREGLQSNPGNYELLLELGRIYRENRKDIARARNVWELALRNWREKEFTRPEPNILACAQLLGQLAKLEEEEKNYSKAIEYLSQLKKISPYPPAIQQWINDIEQKSSSSAP